MREYQLIIDEALRKGLSPLDTTPFNTQYLNEFFGWRCGLGGPELYELLDNPIPSTINMYYSWPFPQFIVGKAFNILIVRNDTLMEDVLYTVSDDFSTITMIDTISHITYGKGGLYEYVDYGEYAIITNGIVFMYYNVTSNAWNTVTTLSDIPLMRTICNFRGQTVGGNVAETWYDCGSGYYIWSAIGNLNFTISGTSEAGYRVDPYGGTVYNVKSMRNFVVGYSSKGVVLISPTAEPISTMSFAEVSDIGLINKGAMNGDLERQIYIGNDYRIREITSEGVKDLGYKNYIENLTSDDIIVNYEPSKKDFYISDGETTYLLSPTGLSRIQQHPSTVWRVGDESYMLPASVDTYEPLIVTMPFDLGYAGQKSISSIETDLLYVDSPMAAVDYFNSFTSFGTSTYKPFNNQNVASVNVSGNAFAFRIKFTPTYINSRISYITARYKMTDLRGIRGVYAPPIRGQQ